MYDAFISYRHTDPDRFVAENLHKKLEAFRIPESIVRQKGGDCKRKFDRVFRDRDELPLASNLEDPIVKALEASNFLIVICSPRLRQSQWCKKEIETFIAMHGSERVLAVLVEGEPEESFPEELLYRERKVTGEDGTETVVREAVEPLAADVRGRNKREILKRMNGEILRLAAAMIGCGYDDLKQRHKERKMKRLLTVSLVISSVLLIFGSVSTAMAFRIRNQKSRIEEQKIQIEEQYLDALKDRSRSLAEKSLQSLKKGNREEALDTALQAFGNTEDGVPVPLTAEAQYALTECSYVYQNKTQMVPYQVFEHRTSVSLMQVSPDREKILTVDCSGEVSVRDVLTGDVLYRVQTDAFGNQEENECHFLTDQRIVYRNGKNLEVYDLQEKEVVFRLEALYTFAISDPGGKKLAIGLNGYTGSASVAVYDQDTGEKTAACQFREGYGPGKEALFEPDGNRLIFSEEPDAYSGQTGAFVRILNAETGENVTEYPAEYSDIGFVKPDGEMLWICENQTMQDADVQEGDALTASLKHRIVRLNPDTGKTEWEFRSEGEPVRDCFPGTQDRKSPVFVAFYDEACILDRNTGEILKHYGFGSEIIRVIPMEEANLYQVLTRDGGFHIISGKDFMDYGRDDYFLQEDSVNIRGFDLVRTGYVFFSWNSRTVLHYVLCSGEDMEQVSKTENSIRDLGICDETDRILVATYPEDGKTGLYLMDAETGETIAGFYFDSTRILFGFTGNGAGTFYVIDGQESLRVYDSATGRLKAGYKMPDSFQYRNVWVRDRGKHLLFQGYGSVFYLDTETGIREEPDLKEPFRTLEKEGKIAVGTVLLRYAGTDTEADTLKILDTEGRLLQEISIPASYVKNLFFVRDDEEILVQYEDKRIQVFSVETGEMKLDTDSVQTGVNGVSPAGNFQFLRGDTEGFFFDRDWKLIARVPDCKAVSLKKQTVFTASGKEIFRFPFYTPDRLLEISEKILKSCRQ